MSPSRIRRNLSRAAFGACAVAIAAWPLLASASAPDSGATTAPSAAPGGSGAATPAPAGPQPDVSAEGFGDFGGARSKLAAHGVTLRGHYVAESSSNPLGGVTTGTAYASELMLGSDLDLAKMVPGSALGTFHVTLTEREGSSLSQNTLDNVLTVQEIYGDGLTPHVTEASYDQTFLKGALDLSLGRIITENDFADSPKDWGTALYCDYQSNAICGTPIAAPIDAGYVAYPSSAWGARLKGNVTKALYLEGAFYQVDPLIGTAGHGLSLGLGGDTGTYFPVEAGLALDDPAGTTVGNVRIGGYYDTSVAKAPGSNLARFDPNEAAFLDGLPTPSYRGREGAWLQADHLIAGSALPNRRGTAVFAAAEYGDPQTSLISAFVDGGVVRHGIFADRPNDVLAVGYAYADFNPRLRDLEASLERQGMTSVPITNQEQIVETAYTAQVVPWLALRPGLQYVVHPSGIEPSKDPLVLDLSTAITF